MTIPNVTMSWAQHRALCDWCSKPVNSGEEIIKVFFWNAGNPDGKRFYNIKKYYHPDCWMEQGREYLRTHPYISSHKGKDRMEITDEQRAQRNKILKRKAALELRKRNITPDNPRAKVIEAGIDRQISELVVEIALLGGIPTKWIEQKKE